MSDKAKDWRESWLKEPASGLAWPILERYLLPGKDTGFVVVCGNRKCFGEIRGVFWPLGTLPDDISPESRQAVVGWAVAREAERRRESLRRACGEPPPDAGR